MLISVAAPLVGIAFSVIALVSPQTAAEVVDQLVSPAHAQEVSAEVPMLEPIVVTGDAIKAKPGQPFSESIAEVDPDMGELLKALEQGRAKPFTEEEGRAIVNIEYAKRSLAVSSAGATSNAAKSPEAAQR